MDTSAPRDYPTLTDDERATVLSFDAALEALEVELEAVLARRKAVRAERDAIFEAAALRDVTPEQVSLTYRTTGKGYADLRAIVRDMHPYLYDVNPFGMIGAPLTLAAHLALTGSSNAPEQVDSCVQALLHVAALVAPDGGMSMDPEGPPHEVDQMWMEHAQGMHPVDILEDDCGATRSLLLAHSADGTRAVLMDQRRSWRYSGGIVATGTLTEVLTEAFRIAREDQDDDED
jgi:hypothetical protein